MTSTSGEGKEERDVPALFGNHEEGMKSMYYTGILHGTNGIFIKNSFEVKKGATLEIR